MINTQSNSGSLSVYTLPQDTASRPVNSSFSTAERYDSDGWSEASKENPCPICNKPDWCGVAENGNAALCRRVDIAPPGWKKLQKVSEDGYPIFAKEGTSSYSNPIGSRKPILKDKSKSKPKTKAPKAVHIAEGQQELAKILAPVTHPERRKRGKQIEIEYRYSESQWVLRVERPNPDKPKGYEKSHYPYHIDAAGIHQRKKGEAEWLPYRMDEIIKYGAGKWVVGVEGEPCVEATRYLGLVAFTFQGSGWTQKVLEQDAIRIKQAGVAGVFYLPDNDEQGTKKADLLQKACAKAELPCIVLGAFTLWGAPPDNGDDIKDWVKWVMDKKWSIEQARDYLEKLFRESVEAQQQKKTKKEASKNDDEPLSKTAFRYAMIEGYWGKRLRLNELKNIIELDGKPLQLDTIQITVALEMNIDCPKEEAIAICATIAKRNAYNPVRDYLDQCYQNNEPIDIGNLATRWFGTTDPLANIYLKRYLIGAVARIYEPGCKNDTALILQGNQGIKKSTFFRVLHEGSKIRQPHKTWFDDTMSDVSNKDERDKLHRFWCLEWGELERVLRKGDDLVKAFISTKADTYRPPYGREPVTKLRQSVIVGTTNRDEFLSDDSGDRRYWVVKVEQHIDINQIEAERNQVWAAAVAAHKGGQQWHLTDEEQKLSGLANSDFHTSDTWEVYVSEYVQGLDQCTTAEILEKALDFDRARQDRASQMRVASILKRLGWKKKKIHCQGKRTDGWVAPQGTSDNNFPPTPPKLPVAPVAPVAPSSLEVRHPSNEAESMLSSPAVAPVVPFYQNFSEKKQSEDTTPPAMSLVQESLEAIEVQQARQEKPEVLPIEHSEGVAPTVAPVVVGTDVRQVEEESGTEISPQLMAMLLRDAQSWLEVEVIIATAPEQKEQVWALLPDEQKARIKQMKQAPIEQPTLSQKASSKESEELLLSGGAVGMVVRLKDTWGNLSAELFEIESWCDRNGVYYLDNGQGCYPCELALA